MTTKDLSWQHIKRNLDLSQELQTLISAKRDAEALALYQTHVTTAYAALAYAFHLSGRCPLPPTTAQICNIHHTLFHQVHPKSAGQLRRTHAFLFPNAVTTCDPPRITQELELLYKQTQQLLAKADSPAAMLNALAFHHARFEAIHPFLDGNGRTGRLILSTMAEHLFKKPLPLCQYLLQNKERYIESLSISQRNDLTPLVTLLAHAADCPQPQNPVISPYQIRPTLIKPKPRHENNTPSLCHHA